MILDKFGGAVDESPVPLSSTGDSSTTKAKSTAKSTAKCAVFLAHSEFPDQVLGVSDLSLGYPAIGLGQAPGCNKQRFQKNRLAQGVLQWVGTASAVVADTVDEPSCNESEEGAGNPSEVVARNQADDLEHACSCFDGVRLGLDRKF